MTDQPVLKLTSPTDICEAIPFLVGFEPTDSLVVIALNGPNMRAGVTARVDLPRPGQEIDHANMIFEHLVRNGADAIIAVTYGTREQSTPIAATLSAFAEAYEIRLVESLNVTDGRWTSFACHLDCCPESGTPLRGKDNPGKVAAAMVAETGKVVLSSRAELEQGLDHVEGDAADAMSTAITQASAHRATTADTAAYDAYAVQLARDWIASPDAPPLYDLDAAQVIVTMAADKEVRDLLVREAVTGANADRVVALWSDLVRRAVLEGFVAPVATLLGIAAYVGLGNGALGNIALDRALRSHPGYTLATYIMALLDNGIPPNQIRDLFDAFDETATESGS